MGQPDLGLQTYRPSKYLETLETPLAGIRRGNLSKVSGGCAADNLGAEITWANPLIVTHVCYNGCTLTIQTLNKIEAVGEPFQTSA